MVVQFYLAHANLLFQKDHCIQQDFNKNALEWCSKYTIIECLFHKELSKVKDFTTRAELHHRVERISEADTLAGLPLLLTGEA